MNLRAIQRLTTVPLSGFWFRALNFRHLNERLKTDHTRTTASRFSPASIVKPLYRTLYLADNLQTAAYEVDALFGSPTNPTARPDVSWLHLSLEVRLYKIIDLTDSREIQRLRTTHQELTGNWRNSESIAPTQSLGVALYDSAGIEGFIYPSAKLDGRNLLIFPDKLDKNSSIIFRNESTHRRERLR